MEELRVRFNNTAKNREKKEPIVNQKPKSWTTKQTMNFFNCTKYLVNRVIQAKDTRRILTMPARKQRQGITEEAKLQVVTL